MIFFDCLEDCEPNICLNVEQFSKDCVNVSCIGSVSKSVKFEFRFQSDFLEADAIKNAVILSTVLQEVRNKSGPGYKRIRELLSLPSKRFYAFVNEHHW